MVSGDGWERYRERDYWIIYPQACSVIEFLESSHGHQTVKDIFDRSKRTTPDTALKNTIGMNMDELEAAWRAWFLQIFVDSDGDGLNNARENTIKTNSNVWDTDGDGLADGVEVTQFGTDPTNPDTDNDGLNDGDEVNIATDGLKQDWLSLDIKPLLDPKNDNTPKVNGTDIQSIYGAFDNDFLYLGYEFHDGINYMQRVQFCFGIDLDGDGKWEYQPGFDIFGNAWLWNLTQGSDYSNMTKFSSLYGTSVGAKEIVELCMPLFILNNPRSIGIEPYVVIQQGQDYVSPDGVKMFHLNLEKGKLPETTDPLVPDDGSGDNTFIAQKQPRQPQLCFKQ
jgi:hypothetical protein